MDTKYYYAEKTKDSLESTKRLIILLGVIFGLLALILFAVSLETVGLFIGLVIAAIIIAISVNIANHQYDMAMARVEMLYNIARIREILDKDAN